MTIPEIKKLGRREPYTEIGIRRKKCVRCGRKASAQWNCCALDNLWFPVCFRCDNILNWLACNLMFGKEADIVVPLRMVRDGGVWGAG